MSKSTRPIKEGYQPKPIETGRQCGHQPQDSQQGTTPPNPPSGGSNVKPADRRR